MTDQTTITYTCRCCGYVNIWTRDQIVQRGKKEIYRDGDLEEYSLPCKNPTLQPACPCRHKVGLERKE